jgi:ATP synthase I subunit
MAEDAAFYDRALVRIMRVGMVLGGAGTVYAWVRHGSRAAIGFLVGSLLSLFNFHSLRRLAEGLGAGSGAPFGGSAVFYGLRYFMVGGAVYVIVKVLEISLMSVLAGLFVAAAAIIVEILYELIYART